MSPNANQTEHFGENLKRTLNFRSILHFRDNVKYFCKKVIFKGFPRKCCRKIKLRECLSIWQNFTPFSIFAKLKIKTFSLNPSFLTALTTFRFKSKSTPKTLIFDIPTKLKYFVYCTEHVNEKTVRLCTEKPQSNIYFDVSLLFLAHRKSQSYRPSLHT
jgi:hypothetical protein